VAAVITTSQIADEFGRRDDLFSSVGGSPAACAVGVAVLEVLAEERLQENAREVGYYLTERLRSLTQRHPVITGVHGMGLYRGIELVRQEDGPAPARMEAGAICDRMRQLGVIISTTGDARNVLKVKPPLCVTHDDIDTFASALDVTLTQGW
jgi:4-aminobutyrate aminotransferase-like enzyme